MMSNGKIITVIVSLLFSVPALAQQGGQTRQDAGKVLAAYYDIKDALVATSAKEASQKADVFIRTLKSVDHSKMSTAEKESFDAYSRKLETYAKEVYKNKDVEKQRTQFELLSKEMTAFAKTFKPEKAYIQYCPMAADGKGASWLSNKREIANPYFGSRMMKCGKVTEEI